MVEIDRNNVFPLPPDAIVGFGVLDQVPHVFFSSTPLDVRAVPHAVTPVLERHPRVGDRVWIDLVQLDNRKARDAAKWTARAVADRKAERVLPGDGHGQMPTHVIEVALRADVD